jgi:nitroreductase
MDFTEVLSKRFSVRKFENKQVEKEKLLEVLDAGRIAPTAGNYQPFKILVVETPKGIEKMWNGYQYSINSPVALIVCADTNTSWKRPFDGKDYGDVDVSIVTDHMMLAAENLGLGSLWIGAFEPNDIRAKFNIPEQYIPVNILLIGYPASDAIQLAAFGRIKKPLDELVVYESF